MPASDIPTLCILLSLDHLAPADLYLDTFLANIIRYHVPGL
jgi:hypothetical protein